MAKRLSLPQIEADERIVRLINDTPPTVQWFDSANPALPKRAHGDADKQFLIGRALTIRKRLYKTRKSKEMHDRVAKLEAAVEDLVGRLGTAQSENERLCRSNQSMQASYAMLEVDHETLQKKIAELTTRLQHDAGAESPSDPSDAIPLSSSPQVEQLVPDSVMEFLSILAALRRIFVGKAWITKTQGQGIMDALHLTTIDAPCHEERLLAHPTSYCWEALWRSFFHLTHAAFGISKTKWNDICQIPPGCIDAVVCTLRHFVLHLRSCPEIAEVLERLSTLEITDDDAEAMMAMCDADIHSEPCDAAGAVRRFNASVASAQLRADSHAARMALRHVPSPTLTPAHLSDIAASAEELGGLVVLSLFDGIGAAAVALASALGLAISLYVAVEIDDAAHDMLLGNMRGKITSICRVNSVTDADGIDRALGGQPVHLLIAGSPCDGIAGSNVHRKE